MRWTSTGSTDVDAATSQDNYNTKTNNALHWEDEPAPSMVLPQARRGCAYSRATIAHVDALAS